MPPAVWKAAATRHIENFNDVAHLSFIHADTFGNRHEPRIPPYEVTWNGKILHFHISYPQIEGNVFVENPKPVMVRYDYDMDLLFSARLKINHPEGKDSILYDIAGPISAKETRVYFIILRNYDLGTPTQPWIEFQKSVLDEDQPTVEDQRPENLPLDLREEVHIYADRFSIEYRKLLADMGIGRPFSS